VYTFLTAARISSALAPRLMVLPSDLLILALPSMPGRRPTSGTKALASTRISRPTVRLKRRTISLHCSIIGIWSSPTGTTLALKAVMSLWERACPRRGRIRLNQALA